MGANPAGGAKFGLTSYLQDFTLYIKEGLFMKLFKNKTPKRSWGSQHILEELLQKFHSRRSRRAVSACHQAGCSSFKSAFLTLVIGLALGVVLPTSAGAVSTSTPVAGSVTACQAKETALTTKITNFETVKTKHITAYTNIKTRLTTVALMLDALNIDSTKIKADTTALDTKITQLTTDYTTYNTQLQQTQTYTCGKSNGEFRTSLTQSRADLLVVRTDITGIQTYINSTIKTDLQSLKALVLAKATATPTVATGATATATSTISQ